MKTQIYFKTFLLSFSMYLTAFCFSAESYFYSPLIVKRAKDAVFRINHPSGQSTGFFLEDSETFLTTFHFIYSLAKTLPHKPFTDSIVISKEELKFKVKRVKALSALDNLAVLEVEGYDGHFLNLSQSPFHIDQDIYTFKSSKEDIELTKARRIIKIPPFQFGFVSPIQSKEAGAGSPVLNSDGEVIGMVENADSHIISAVHEQPIQYLIHRVSSENHHLPEEIQIENTLTDLQIRAYEQEDVSAQVQMGLILSEEKQSHSEAVSILQKAVLKNNTLAQFHLGSFLFSGELGSLNKEQGFSLLEKAAQSGYPPAQFQVGVILLYGDDVILQDTQQSFFWMKSAAESGHNKASNYMGEMFRLGLGIYRNSSLSIFWMDKYQVN